MRSAAASGFNTLLVQVRGRGDAYYASRVEPRAEPLASQPSSFDPLATVIALARADEIGRLATSFNAMAAEVGRGRGGLGGLVELSRPFFA